MAGDLTEIDTRNKGKQAPRGVYLTEKARKEYSAVEPQTAEFIRTVMTTWAWAKDAKEEPQPKKFKRLGEFPSGSSAMPSVSLCEFKRKTTRLYGHEMKVGGRPATVIVMAATNDKGGQTGKRQNHSIGVAAKRAGELYD